ncbi:MAG: hypothetical protein J5933_05095 [Clostridia bacterium]|nr:hypothetical protein [Clostridia bacterium]
MKMRIRIAALAMCVLLIVPLMLSCGATETEGDDTSGPDETAAPYDSETGSVESRDTEGTVPDEPPADPVVLFKDGTFNCIIVYPQYESELIEKSAKSISALLGEVTGAQYPLALTDKLFKEEKYPGRCIILVGKTNVQGTEDFEAASSYGCVTAKLIGNKYQINIHDETDGAAFCDWLRGTVGESPSEIVVDSSWNVSIPTSGGITAKIVKMDSGANGSLINDSGVMYSKTVWATDKQDYEDYIGKCVSSGFEIVDRKEKGESVFTLLSGDGTKVLAWFNGENDQTTISITDQENTETHLLDPSEYENDYEKWLAYSSDYCDRLNPDSIVTADSSALAWSSAYVLNALLRAYCATDDMRYLTKMADSLYGIYLLAEDKDGDGYRNWGVSDKYGGVGYNEFVVHSGAIASAAADFLNLLAGEPSLYSARSEKHGMSFREMADYILRVNVEDIIPAFDCDWSERYGVYMNRLTLAEQDGLVAEETLPHNQYLMMAYALIELSKLDIGEERVREYLDRADRMVSVFDSFVRRNEDNTMYWRYADVIGEFDKASGVQDTSHGMIDIRTVIAAQNAGMSFTSEDLAAFANTYANVADYDPMPGQIPVIPRLYNHVDGTGSADNHVFLFVYDMSVFSEKIWDMGRRYILLVNGDPSYNEDSLRVLAYHPGAPAPSDFALTSPESDGGKTDPSFVVFRWENSAGAAEYVLTVARDESMSDVVLRRDGLIETSALVRGEFENGTEYFWQITAKGAGGKELVSATGAFLTE